MAQNKDNELGMILIVGGLFTVTLAFVDIFYSDWAGMFQSGWLGIAAVLFHAAAVIAWYLVIKNYEDPNFDGARKWLFVMLVACIAIVAGCFRKMWRRQNKNNCHEFSFKPIRISLL